MEKKEIKNIIEETRKRWHLYFSNSEMSSHLATLKATLEKLPSVEAGLNEFRRLATAQDSYKQIGKYAQLAMFCGTPKDRAILSVNGKIDLDVAGIEYQVIDENSCQAMLQRSVAEGRESYLEFTDSIAIYEALSFAEPEYTTARQAVVVTMLAMRQYAQSYETLSQISKYRASVEALIPADKKDQLDAARHELDTFISSFKETGTLKSSAEGCEDMAARCLSMVRRNVEQAVENISELKAYSKVIEDWADKKQARALVPLKFRTNLKEAKEYVMAGGFGHRLFADHAKQHTDMTAESKDCALLPSYESVKPNMYLYEVATEALEVKYKIMKLKF